MNNIYNILAVIGFSVLLIAGLSWWGGQSASPELLTTDDKSDFEAPLSLEEQKVVKPDNINNMNPVAIFETNLGNFELELFNDVMPVTAGNFITLAESGFYNDVKFHRVIDGFMIQGGDPNTKTGPESSWGTGGPGYAIADEHISDPRLSNVRGTISMANSGPNSGGSQFFINTVDNSFLDFDKEPLSSKHPVFGRIISGMEVIDSISKVPTKPGDRPVEPVVIKLVTIKQVQ